MARFPEADESWVATLRQSYESNLARHVKAVPTASRARKIYAWDALANDYRELAYLLYASGEPLKKCRELLLQSSQAYAEALNERGDETGVGRDADWAPLSDYSTGNSCSAYRSICMAITAGATALAKSMAPFVWDPHGAEYVARNSVICTTNRQALAYALRNYLLRADDEAITQLKRMSQVTEEDVGEMLLLRGLVSREPAMILKGLQQTLDWHAREAALKENFRVLKYFLCIPALGLASLALQQGLLAHVDLPADNPYFPRDMLAD